MLVYKKQFKQNKRLSKESIKIMSLLSNLKSVDHHFTNLYVVRIQETTSKTFLFGNNFTDKVNLE